MTMHQNGLIRKDGGGGKRPTLSLLALAVSEALTTPLPIPGGVGSPLAAACDEHGEWQWAVFSNCHPRKTVLATTRALCKKLRACYPNDDEEYYGGQFVSTYDLEAKSGEWPETVVDDDPDFCMAAAYQKHRLVLCNHDEAVGFCTAETVLTQRSEQDEVEATLKIRAVFIDERERGFGRSYLLAEAVARLEVAMLKEFQSRLEQRDTVQKCYVALDVKGEPISDAGARFARSVMDELEEQLRDAMLFGSCSAGIVLVKKIDLSFED